MVLTASLALLLLPLTFAAHPEGRALPAVLLKLLAAEPEAAAGACAAMAAELLVHVGALQRYPFITKAARTKQLALRLVFRNVGGVETAATTVARAGLATALLMLCACLDGKQVLTK